jgi:hypothetical protein
MVHHGPEDVAGTVNLSAVGRAMGKPPQTIVRWLEGSEPRSSVAALSARMGIEPSIIATALLQSRTDRQPRQERAPYVPIVAQPAPMSDAAAEALRLLGEALLAAIDELRAELLAAIAKTGNSTTALRQDAEATRPARAKRSGG